MTNDVSVVIPVYNGENWLRNAIQSVLNQTKPAIEIVVIDDGSVDSSIEIANSFQSSQINVISKSNGGVASARNRGILETSASLIAFLDQDDEWMPKKLESQVQLFVDPHVGAVGSLMYYISSDGRKVGLAGETTLGRESALKECRFMPFPPSSMILRRDCINSVGGFDERLVTELGPVDDIDLISRIAEQNKILTVQEPLGLYRIHDSAGSFKKFYDMQDATKYLQHRYKKRQEGIEVSISDWKKTKPPLTLDDKRRVRARFYYRVAGNRLSTRSWPRGLSSLAGAFLLDPLYTITRLRRQKFGR